MNPTIEALAKDFKVCKVIEAGRIVTVFKIEPGTGERLDLLATAFVGEGGWVELNKPIIVRAGEAFIAVALTPPDSRLHSCPNQSPASFSDQHESVGNCTAFGRCSVRSS